MSKFAEVLMQLALDTASEGIRAGQTPFGCAIRLGDGQIVAKHNTVFESKDITAHAEVNAIREANRVSGEMHLTGAIVATTCEPCPMCMAALHWARVREVYFGATIADAADAGFNEIDLAAADVVKAGGNKVILQGGVMHSECREQMQSWAKSDRHATY